MTAPPLPPPLPPEPPRAEPRRGCFFYGCLVALVLFVAGGIAAWFLVRHGLDMLVETVEEHTDTEPMPLPESTMSEAEYRQLERRLAEFGAALDAGEVPPPLVLTGDDLNALIAHEPECEPLRDRLYVSLVDDRIEGECRCRSASSSATCRGCRA